MVVAPVAGVLLAAGATGASARSTRAVSCATHGLVASAAHGSAYHVVSLEAAGISCAAARGVARQVAVDLARSEPVSFPRASGLSISEQSCTGCAPRTEVAVSFPRGEITISLRGAATPAPAGGQGGVVTA